MSLPSSGSVGGNALNEQRGIDSSNERQLLIIDYLPLSLSLYFDVFICLFACLSLRPPDRLSVCL